jgi:hypothetical protein
MPIRVFLHVVRSPACLHVEAKKRKEREGGSWDTQKRRRSSSSSEGAQEKKKGKVKLRKLTPPLEC